ncbi:MAG TPA: hypothetical protein VIK75_02905, partial [Calditerricola sp.]
GNWREEQVARESLQDRLASLPYEVLEEFLRQRGYEPTNRGHALILMARHFQTEAEELIAKHSSGASFLSKRDTVSDTAATAVAETVSDTETTTALNTGSNTASETAADTISDTVYDTNSNTVSDATSATVVKHASDTVSDTTIDTSSDTADTEQDTIIDTVSDTAATADANREPGLVDDGRGSEIESVSPERKLDGSLMAAPSRVLLPGWEEPVEIPAPEQVRWVPANQWRGPGRGAAGFLRERARWWMERRSAVEAGATHFVGVYLLPEQRATLQQLGAETGMEAYKLVGLALELLLYEMAGGEALPELPPREGRTSRTLDLLGLQARPRLDREGERLFVRLYPPVWQAIERVSKGSQRSASETCNIAVFALAATLRQLAS